MIKVLKIAMILWAAVSILYGLYFLFLPQKVYSGLGLEQAPGSMTFFLGSFGIACIIPSIFVILATRDPLKHIMWVHMALAWSLVDIITTSYFIIQGNMTFSQAGIGIILDIIFIVVVSFILYPWRKAPVS
jgi:hypothetical protein